MHDSAPHTISVPSPVGWLRVTAEGGRITRLSWGRGGTGVADAPDTLQAAARQLTEYFDGARRGFDLPVRIEGTPFQQDFLRALIAIPFGETRRYGDLAKELGVSAQAIGQACGANPIAVIIPCHRVLAASGLGGYSGAGGVETKVALLRHEGAASLLI